VNLHMKGTFFEIVGGRSRTRTYDPLIKRFWFTEIRKLHNVSNPKKSFILNDILAYLGSRPDHKTP